MDKLEEKKKRIKEFRPIDDVFLKYSQMTGKYARRYCRPFWRTVYHIDKVIRESGKVIDDGLREVFVNTSVDDGTLIADLMRCFLQKEVHDPRFPKLSSRMSCLKEDIVRLVKELNKRDQYMKILEQGGELKPEEITAEYIEGHTDTGQPDEAGK